VVGSAVATLVVPDLSADGADAIPTDQMTLF
jgi:hypothetical protein